jgi:uncharacterized protein (TIGR00369 family)
MQENGAEDFEKRVRESFARQQAMHTLGVVISRLERGVVELEMPYAAAFTQQHGFMHAGVIATALDTACGYAAFSMMDPRAAILTIEFKSNFLAPAKGDRFRFVANVVKHGRTISVCDAQAFAQTAAGEKLIATMTATVMAVIDRPGIEH